MITGLVSWVIISTFHIGWITAKKKGGKFKLQYIQYTEPMITAKYNALANTRFQVSPIGKSIG